MTAPIISFTGGYRWLSNFWPSSVAFEGDQYSAIENAYQAAKTHRDLRQPFFACPPGVAKRLGRGVTIPTNWEAIKVPIMAGLLDKKFAEGSLFAQKLLETGDAHLEEGNTWGDRFWGTVGGVGRNQLGMLLMARRTQLQHLFIPNGDLF